MMAAQKRVIKGGSEEEKQTRVEKVDFADRRFHDRVFKDAPVDEDALEMESVQLEQDPDMEEGAQPPAEETESAQEVKMEKFYDDDGNLEGLKITCRCGEVIEIEFTRE